MGSGEKGMDDKLLYRVRDAADYLSLSRAKVYELLRAGRIASVRVDGCRRIRGEELRRYVASLAEVLT
jgi:excisionase family DNA binding protein